MARANTAPVPVKIIAVAIAALLLMIDHLGSGNAPIPFFSNTSTQSKR